MDRSTSLKLEKERDGCPPMREIERDRQTD